MCHNDLSPKNTVYRGGLPVAFIDWDIAAPGRRVHDVAHVCWQFVPLGPAVEVSVAARRVRVVLDAYEECLSPVGSAGEPGGSAAQASVGGQVWEAAGVLDVVLWWQDRCWRGIESAARTGDAAMVRLRDAGVAGAVRAAYAWTLEHRDELARV
ncbi:phosphotransferase [Actinoplanes sp. NPDC049316]|uniref:phosphotransferase n=1 Tax=Actinoplanes sp. NPDC049316 TaxID=3154727 RepID=UPI003412682B